MTKVVAWVTKHKKRAIAWHDHGKNLRVTFTPASGDKQYRTMKFPDGISLIFSFSL